MKTKRNARLFVMGIRLFLLSAICLFPAITARAGDVKLFIRQNQSGFLLEKSVYAEEVFGRWDLYPGAAETGSITLRNQTGQKLWYCFDSAGFETGSTVLYENLHLKIFERSGTVLYEGALMKAAFRARELPAGVSERLLYELYLPIEAGNEVIGQTLDFRLCYLASEHLSMLPDPDSSEKPGGDGSGDGTEDEDGKGNQGDGEGEGGSGGGGTGDSETGGDDGTGGGTDSEGGTGGSNGSGNGSSSGGSTHSGTGGGSGSGNKVVGYGYGSGNSSGGGNSGSSTGGTAGTAVGGGSGHVKIYDQPGSAEVTALSGGKWVLVDAEKKHWSYQLPDGTVLSGGFAFLLNPYGSQEKKGSWFHFGADGIMSIGWVRVSEADWYFMHDTSDGRLGELRTGWHFDQEDKRTYYLHPVTGRMQTGWVEISENGAEKQQYYFARLEDTYRQNWFFNTAFGRWIYDMLGNRTYGSMYRGEETPDGHRVAENGAKCV